MANCIQTIKREEMNLRNFIRLCALAVVSAVGISCTDDALENKNLNEDLTFSLELIDDSIEANKAKIRVKHNGTRYDTWYAFATKESNINKAVSQKIMELLNGKDKISRLNKVTRKNVTVNKLEPETDYTFIVIGLTEDGTPYGNPATLEFTTTRDLTNLDVSDEWKITYERGKYEGVTAELVTVECAEDSRYYFEYVPETYVLDVDGTDLIHDYVTYLVNDEIPFYLESYDITQFTYTGPGTFPLERMTRGNYYAICIGYDETGMATGTYTATLFTVVEEEATAEYNQWIGKYDMTAANGANYEVNIAHYDNNYMYVMYGWETGDELDANGGMCFDNQFGDNAVFFGVYYSDGKLLFNEQIITSLEVTNQNNQTIACYLGLYGYGQSEEETLQLMLSNGGTIATGVSADGAATATITGESGENEDGTTSTYTHMGYAAIAQDYSDVFLWNQPAEFPITMTRKDDAAEQQSIGTFSLESERFNRKSALENITLKNPRMTMKIAR